MLYEAIGGLLDRSGLGTLKVDILVALPDQHNKCIAVREYAGSPPLHVKGAQEPALHRPRVQVVARAEDYDTARTRAHDAYGALSGFAGVLDGSYYSIRALQSPFPLGTDDSGRWMFAVNFEVLQGGGS